MLLAEEYIETRHGSGSHVRKVRKLYQERREYLLATVAKNRVIYQSLSIAMRACTVLFFSRMVIRQTLKLVLKPNNWGWEFGLYHHTIRENEKMV